MFQLKKTSIFIGFIFFNLLFITKQSYATTVMFKTNVGDFEVELFDTATPKTVANFLTYVNDGSYDNTVIHRLADGFVVQGGGFGIENVDIGNGVMEDKIVKRPTNAEIENEPVYSNVIGTIAMAKTADPDSATRQWFFNLKDNSSQLDIKSNSGGFTVFGVIRDQGMDVIDVITDKPRLSFAFNDADDNQTFKMRTVTAPLFENDALSVAAAFVSTPLVDYTSTDYDAETHLTLDNLLIIESITVTNADPDSAANLTPVENTLINQQSTSSGGSFNFILLALMGLIVLYKTPKK